MKPHDADTLSAEETRVRTALQALPSANADPAFQARLRAQFTADAFDSRIGSVISMSPPEGGSWVGTLLAVAACLVLAVFTFDSGPTWQITRVQGQGAAMVGDRMVPLDAAALSAALARGGRLRLPSDGSVELVAAGCLAMSLEAGSDVVIPRSPGRWFARTVRAEVLEGEAFMTTGRGFHGAHLTVVTDEATVEVVGTTFAVLRHPEGTCVCVMEGLVSVAAVGEAPVEVGAGLRRFCFPRGTSRPSESAPILDYSEHELHELRTSTAKLLER